MSVNLFSLLILPLGLLLSSFSSARVETNVQTGSNEGTSVKVEARSESGESSVKVETREPGSVEVKVNNGTVSIKKSQGTQPTIIITTSPDKVTLKKENPERDKANDLPFSNIKDKVSRPIYNYLRGFWMRLFRVFNIKT